MKRAVRHKKGRFVTFGAGLLATREHDATTLFERARNWNRIAHMAGTRNCRIAYASKTDALIGAIRVHPERFDISGIENGGWLICVQCNRTRRSLHVQRTELERRCSEWWIREVEALRGKAVAAPSRGA